MPNPPYVPQLVDTGNVERDIKDNITIIHRYLQSLSSYIAEGEPDGGWSVTGVVEDKVLIVGDTLTNTQHFLGTLIQLLTAKGVIGA